MSDQNTGTTDAPANEPATGEPEGTETETPTVEDLLKEIETLKGHSRKWEERAKANKEAADKVAELERSKMTDEERREADSKAVEERVTTAEQERDEAVAALARYKVAVEFGLDEKDAEALASIKDEDTLRALAERLSGRTPGSKPNPAQGRRGSKAAPGTPAEAFADALSDLF